MVRRDNRQQDLIKSLYVDGLNHAKHVSEREIPTNFGKLEEIHAPGWWKKQGYESCLGDNFEKCVEELERNLSPSDNLFRGKASFSGQKIFHAKIILEFKWTVCFRSSVSRRFFRFFF